MTYLYQVEDLFGKRSWWDDTWANTAAEWTVKPVINSVERVGVGLSMSVATMASEKVRAEVDKFTSAACSVGELALKGAPLVADAMFDYVVPVFLIWFNSLSTEQQMWVTAKLSLKGIENNIIQQVLRKKVRVIFRNLLLRKITGFAEMAASLNSLIKARGAPNFGKAALQTLEAIAKQAEPEKGRFGLNKGVPMLKIASVISWVTYTAERSMVEAKKFQRSYPNVWKELQQVRPEKGPRVLFPQDFLYLYFIFGDKLEVLLGFAEDALAARRQMFVLM